jgi:predicted transcriptional regulator
MPKQLKHRSRSEIIASILEVTNGNMVRRTEIQYESITGDKDLRLQR